MPVAPRGCGILNAYDIGYEVVLGPLDHEEIPDKSGLEKNMNRRVVASQHAPDPYCLAYRTAFILLLLGCSTVLPAQNSHGPTSSTAASEVRATQLLGLEGVKNNTKGELSIKDNTVQFQKEKSSAVQVDIGSIQDVVLGEQSKQSGGTAATVGKTATPFGGGRVISLFSHKKYDILTLEYLDSNGGFHGAIFQLDKGQGQIFKNELAAKGAHVTEAADQTAKQGGLEVTSENK